MNLPSEVLLDIFLNLPLKEVLKNCKLNKRANILCNTDEFWRRYLRKHYYVDKIPINSNPKQLAIEIQTALNQMWSRGWIPTFRYPSAYMALNGIDNLIGNYHYYDNNFVTVRFNDKRDKIIEEIIGLNFTINPIINNLNSEEGKKEYERVLNAILIPTVYLTPNGPKIINFDIDIYAIILEKLRNLYLKGKIDHRFNQIFIYKVLGIEKDLYREHFPGRT